jgi:N-acetylmuramic acid 6-phosphate (MurNAc-6-P) etherase
LTTIVTFCRSIVVLMLVALVAACAMTAEQQTARDDERCTARGLKPTTKEHDDCVVGLQASRDSRQQQRHRDLVEQRAPTYGTR